MNKEEARKEVEFYKTLASNHEALVKGCNEKILELEALINKPDRWQDSLVQPDKEDYFYLKNNSSKGLDVCGGSKSKRKPEHAFKTKEQAKLIKEKVLLMQEMHAFAHARNEGWVPDWNDGKVGKFGILYNAYDEFEVLGSFWCNYFVFGISVKSMEIAVEMFEEFGERIKEIYNIQY